MGRGPSAPTFNAIVDFGLRDVGVQAAPRTGAAYFGKTMLRMVGLVWLSLVVVCVIAGATGAGRWIVTPLAVLSTAVMIVVALRRQKGGPIAVVTVTAEKNPAARWMVVLFALFALSALLAQEVAMVPPVALVGVAALLAWRGRGRTPEVLRELGPLLAADETVLGDGAGLAPGTRRWTQAFRLLVATDRRLLVVASPQRPGPFALLDLPYDRITGFAVAWKYMGRAGELSLRTGAEAHVIGSIAPANLVSIVRALRVHGVSADDPVAVGEAEAAWEEAKRTHATLTGTAPPLRAPAEAGPTPAAAHPDASSQPREPRRAPARALFDRATMNTRAFDRGLWLLLALGAASFYVNPFGLGIGMSRDLAAALLIAVPAASALCGYVAGTRSSLAYLVPLNMLVSPAFFFAPASYVAALMFVLSLAAAAGLWVGARMHESRDAQSDPEPRTDEPRAPRGTLREAVSGLGLIRLSTLLLVGVLMLVAAGTAAGFDSTTLRMAIEEATARQLPVDGSSNLTGGAASLSYTPGPGLHELITDQHFSADPADGARWELRSSWKKNLNVVSLASYDEKPRLDDPATVADFIARKDTEHAGLAGFHVTHTRRVVHGRTGYVWNHGSRRGYWYYAAWFPRPGRTVRVECIAKRETDRFKRLCAQAMATLRFER